MQAPSQPERVVSLPKPPAPVEEHRYDFTTNQMEVVQSLLTRLNMAEKEAAAAEKVVADTKMFLSVFMSYLQKETKFQPDMNWSLAQDDEGRPYMKATPKPKK